MIMAIMIVRLMMCDADHGYEDQTVMMIVKP